MSSLKFRTRLPPLPSPNDLLKMYNLRAKKHLSQNFLLDCKLQSKIISVSSRIKNSHVLEVGPGPGCLTRPIFEQGALYVNVIEKDTRFLQTLELIKESTQSRLGIHVGDVLKTDLEFLFPKELAKPWDQDLPNMQIIGNLPFNVATPLIIKWLHQISLKTSAWTHGRVPLTLTFQKEVGERMVANPHSMERSRLSIMCQNWCHVCLKFILPGKVFLPKPQVDVAVVLFTPRIKPVIDLDFEIVEKVVKAAFSSKQKNCVNSLTHLFNSVTEDKKFKKILAEKLLYIADIDPSSKPITLSLFDFNRLCHAYVAMKEDHENK